MLFTYFLNDFEMVPVAPIFTGITFVLTFHMRCISIVRSLYFRILSASFLITFLSLEIATSINVHVPFSTSSYFSLLLKFETMSRISWYCMTSLSVSHFVLPNLKAQKTIDVARFSCWNAAGTLFFHRLEIDSVYPQVWHFTVLCTYIIDTKHTLNSTPWCNFSMTFEVSVAVRMKNTVQCNMTLYDRFLRGLLPLPSGSKEKYSVADPSVTLVPS